MQSNARGMAKIHMKPERKHRGKSEYNMSLVLLYECFLRFKSSMGNCTNFTDTGMFASERDYYLASENSSIVPLMNTKCNPCVYSCSIG